MKVKRLTIASSTEARAETDRRVVAPALAADSEGLPIRFETDDAGARAFERRPPFFKPRHERPIKRAMDIVLAIAGFFFASPFLISFWLVVRLTSKGPGLYWSQRLGRNGIAFWMPKFRSMVVDAPVVPREQLDAADAHITSVGKVLRSTSMDELPQLWSILVGDMSVIGPRPLLPTDPGIRARWDFPEAMDIRPGVTGLAQVCGRNLVSPRLKARYDSFYAKRGTWALDAFILWRTAVVVLARRGLL